MRRVIGWLLPLSIAACGLEPDTITYGAGLPLRALNPMLAANSWNEASALILSRLFMPDHRSQVVGDLAREWHVADDGLSLEVTLRDGVRWHDGPPLRAADVTFTFARLFDSSTATDLDLNLPTVREVTARDSLTVAFTLTAPTPNLPAALVEVPILPRHVLERSDINGDAFDQRPVGTGPFRLVARPGDGLWVFRRHDAFHLGRPRVSTIVLREIPDPSERARMLADGAIDLAEVGATDAPALTGVPHVALQVMRTGAWLGMPLNLRNPLLQDPDVRLAISLAVDRDALVLIGLGGLGGAAHLPLAPGTWAFPEGFTVPGHDPARARRLLDGRSLTLRVICWKEETFRRLACELLRRQLADIGIAVVPIYVDNATYARLADDMGDQYDTFIGGWSSLLDPVGNLYKKFHSRGSQNYGAYANSTLDALLSELLTMPQGPEARAAVRQALEIIIRDTPWVPLVYPLYVFGARRGLTGLGEFVTDSWYEFPRYAWEWGWEGR